MQSNHWSTQKQSDRIINVRFFLRKKVFCERLWAGVPTDLYFEFNRL